MMKKVKKKYNLAAIKIKYLWGLGINMMKQVDKKSD